MTPTAGAVVAKNMGEIAKRFNIPYDISQWKDWEPHKMVREERPVPIVKDKLQLDREEILRLKNEDKLNGL